MTDPTESASGRWCTECAGPLANGTRGNLCRHCLPRHQTRQSDYHHLKDQPAWLDDPTNPCRGHLHLYFGTWHERPPARTVREEAARRICGLCPNMHACRTYARTHRLVGIWGAENDLERAKTGHGSFALTGPAGAAGREAKRTKGNL